MNVTVKAIVQKVIPKGNHGPFAISTSEKIDGSITFSLEPTVWKEDEWPENGTVVLLGNLRKKRAGWRAKTGRFWQLSDEQQEQRARSSNMVEFLYPKSRQYPFDEVCEQLVRALEARGWTVPGIDIEFDTYGTGEAKFSLVRSVSGALNPEIPYRIRFGRPQGRLDDGRWNDTAAVTDLFVGTHKLSVYDEESGPTYVRYVGDNWSADAETFMRSMHVNSKLNGELRTYIKYEGACVCQATSGAAFPAVGLLTAWATDDRDAMARMTHTHSGRRSPLLVHDNDLGREYEPEGDEPTEFNTAEVFGEFKTFLEQLLEEVERHLIANEVVNPFEAAITVLMPDSVGPIFTFGKYRDGQRITAGQIDSSELKVSDRYGMQGNGRRLLNLMTGKGDPPVPEVAYDGFLWCGLGAVDAETSIEGLDVSGHYRWSDQQRFVLRIMPKHANGVWIADHAAYETRRQKIGDTLGDRDHFTDAEIAEMDRARARTIIPIAEYEGGFEQPVVLINRELGLDEVEVVSGPHKDWQGH